MEYECVSATTTVSSLYTTTRPGVRLDSIPPRSVSTDYSAMSKCGSSPARLLTAPFTEPVFGLLGAVCFPGISSAVSNASQFICLSGREKYIIAAALHAGGWPPWLMGTTNDYCTAKPSNVGLDIEGTYGKEDSPRPTTVEQKDSWSHASILAGLPV